MIRDRGRILARWLTNIELPLVALLAAAGVVLSRALLPGIAIALAFWPVRMLATGRLSARTAGDLAIGLLLVMTAVTLWVTAVPEVTHVAVLRLLSGVALYYAIVNWATTCLRLHRIGLGIMLVGLGLGAAALVIVRWGNSKLAFMPAIANWSLPAGLVGAQVNGNVMAGILTLLVPLAWGAALFNWRALRWPERLAVILAGLCLPGVVLLTQSRGSLLAMAAAAVVMAALRWRWGWLAAPLCVVGGSVLVWRLGTEQLMGLFEPGSSVGGLSGRPEIWSRALYMIQDFPFTGVGMGLFGWAAALLYPFFMFSPDVEIPHAHNLYLQVAVDLGLPGLIAWLALFILVTLAAWRVYRHGGAPGSRTHFPCLAGLGAGLLCSQLVLALHGLLDAVTWGTRPAVIVWALWGLAMAAWNYLPHATEPDLTVPPEGGTISVGS